METTTTTTTTTTEGKKVLNYRLTTQVELKADNNIADHYFVMYEVKVFDKWKFIDGIGAFDFNDDLNEVTNILAKKTKEKWGVIYG